MELHESETPGEPPRGLSFPSLPIVTPDPPQRSASERYGGLFYLGVAGLLVLGALVGWFAWGAWSLRSVWANVYVLHDPGRSESDRIAAAYTLGRDPGVNQRQYWDMCLRRPLPPLARYILAESLTAEAPAGDPRGYILAVTRSADWPIWLRLLLTRPLAYAAGQGFPLPAEPLRELLSRHYDPALDLWVDFTLAATPPRDPGAAEALADAARSGRPEAPLAELLLAALRSKGPKRTRRLDAATLWLRTHHPEAAKLWTGWKVEGDRLVRKS